MSIITGSHVCWEFLYHQYILPVLITVCSVITIDDCVLCHLVLMTRALVSLEAAEERPPEESFRQQ